MCDLRGAFHFKEGHLFFNDPVLFLNQSGLLFEDRLLRLDQHFLVGHQILHFRFNGLIHICAVGNDMSMGMTIGMGFSIGRTTWMMRMEREFLHHARIKFKMIKDPFAAFVAEHGLWPGMAV